MFGVFAFISGSGAMEEGGGMEFISVFINKIIDTEYMSMSQTTCSSIGEGTLMF